MEKPRTEQDAQRMVNALVAHAYRSLDSGKQPADIEFDLMRQGCSREVALAIITRARQERQRIADSRGVRTYEPPIQVPDRGSSGSEMALGAIICVVGILITAVTYSAASGGGTYVVAWGAIVFGAVRFFKGLSGG